MPKSKTKKLSASAERHLQFMIMEWMADKFPSSFRVIGFDLAKFNTGWTVIECDTRNGKIESHLLEMGLISAGSGSTNVFAASHIHSEMCKLMEKYEPDIVAYENIVVMSTATGFKALSRSEGILHVASRHMGVERLLIPISIAAGKKIALGKNKEDYVKAESLYKQLFPNRNLPRNKKDKNKVLGKYAVMNATKDSFGLDFTDHNICDSFLIATSVVYLARMLHQADKDILNKDFDSKELLTWNKLTWASEFDRPRLEVGIGLCKTYTVIGENDGRYNTKIREEIKRLYNPISDTADRDWSESDDAED